MSEQQNTKLLKRFDEMLLKLEHIESMLLQHSRPKEEAEKSISGKTTEQEKLAILQQEGG